MAEIKRPYPTVGDLLMVVAIFLGMNLLAGMIVAPLMIAGFTDMETMTFLSYLIAMAGTAFFGFLFMKRRSGTGFGSLGFVLKSGDLLLVLWAVTGIYAVGVVIEPLLELFPKSHMDMLGNAIGTGVLGFVTTVVFAAFFEEIVFRGVIQGPSVRRWGPRMGIFVASLIFGVIHIIPAQAVNAFCIGIIIGYVYYRTRSLVPVMLIHAANNCVAFFSVRDDELKDATMRELTGNDMLYAGIYLVAALVVAVVAVNIYRGTDNKRP